MPKKTKKQKKAQKKTLSVPEKVNTSKSVRIQKVSNGFIVNQIVSTKRSFKEKTLVAKTNIEAKRIAAKLL